MRSWLNKTYCTWLLILASYRACPAVLQVWVCVCVCVRGGLDSRSDGRWGVGGGGYTRAFLIPVKRSLQRRRYVLLARHANRYSYYKNTTMFLAKNELILNAVVLSTFQEQPEISVSLFRLFLFIS